MDRNEWEQQIQRLISTYGPNSYPEEVRVLFWRAFSNVDASVFRDAMDDMIANSRARPMLAEITKAVDESRERQKEAMYNAPRLPGAVIDLESLCRVPPDAESEPDRKQWHLARKSLLQDYLIRKITKEHFEEGCLYLDQVLDVMRGKNSPCKSCNASGLIPFRKHGLYRCFCGVGRAHFSTLRHKPSRGEMEDVPIPILSGPTHWEALCKTDHEKKKNVGQSRNHE